MSMNPGVLVKNLGWRGFFRLITHLPTFSKVFIRLMKDPRVSLAPKLLVLAIAAYVVLPLDIVPDFIPGLGQMDDLAVVLVGLRFFLRLCPADIVREHMDAIARRR